MTATHQDQPPEHLFDELKRYVGFAEQDGERLRALWPTVAPHAVDVTDEFYAHILAHHGASAAITGGQAQVERLKLTLQAWLKGVFLGPWDAEYYELRARIGRRHVQIKLPQQYMFSAMSVTRITLGQYILGAAPTRPDTDPAADLGSVHKVLDMDLAIMVHTYREDQQAQLQRQERLSTFGQLVASIGHELRNPLSVVDSSVFILRQRLGQDPFVLKHLDRISGQVQTSNRIITDLMDMVRDRPPQRHALDLHSLAHQAAQDTPVPAGINVQVLADPTLPQVLADGGQVRQVIANLIHNAVQAVGPQGHVQVTTGVDGPWVWLRVEDDGPGVDPAVLARLFEPLITTKTTGVGLGLALCKKLAERNGGTVALARGTLSGACLELRLPAARRTSLS